jgi:transposase
LRRQCLPDSCNESRNATHAAVQRVWSLAVHVHGKSSVKLPPTRAPKPLFPTTFPLAETPLDKHLYAQCHLVECCFSKLKKFLRVATRYEKTARNYLAIATIAATVLWLR